MKYTNFFIALALCVGMQSSVSFGSEGQQEPTSKSWWEYFASIFTQNASIIALEKIASTIALEKILDDPDFADYSENQKKIMREYTETKTELVKLEKELNDQGYQWGRPHEGQGRPEPDLLWDRYRIFDKKDDVLRIRARHNGIDEDDLRKMREGIYKNAGL